MSAQQPSDRYISRTSMPIPVPTETPTLRLGSMLQTVREQNRTPDDLSTQELDAFVRIPRRRLPLFVLTAGVGLGVLGAATWPKAKDLAERFATFPIGGANQAMVVETTRPAAMNAIPANTTPIGHPPIEMAADGSPPALSTHGWVAPSAGEKTEHPRRRIHDGFARSSRSTRPLRGFAWSPAANALVRIENEDSIVPEHGPRVASPSPPEGPTQ